MEQNNPGYFFLSERGSFPFQRKGNTRHRLEKLYPNRVQSCLQWDLPHLLTDADRSIVIFSILPTLRTGAVS